MISLVILLAAIGIYLGTCVRYWDKPDDWRSCLFHVVIGLLFLYSIIDRRGW